MSDKINKTILVLSRTDDRPDYDTAFSMVKSLGESRRNITYEACFLEQLGFVYDGRTLSITNMLNDKDILDYDGIFLLGWFKLRKHEDIALAVARYVTAHGKKILNSEALHNRSRSKVSQQVIAALSGVPQAPFAYIGDQTRLPELLDSLKAPYPYIAKSATGSRGRQNFLVNNLDELRAALGNMPTKPVIVQKFIPNNGDYRILVMGGDVKLIIHRQSETDSHLNNTSQGGRATLVPKLELPARMLEDAVKIAQQLGREVTGVDIIVDQESGQHYFLEANNMPQLSTGSFTTEKAEALDNFFADWLK